MEKKMHTKWRNIRSNKVNGDTIVLINGDTIVLIVLILVIIGILVILLALVKWSDADTCPEGYTCEKIIEPHNWNAYGPSQECLNNQSEVFLESGKPYQFSCNQIRLMIKASAYPSYSNNYTQYCNYGNESHMLGFHGTIYSPPIKYSFVEDYIIRCDGGEG